MNGRGFAETLIITLAALAASLIVFGVFMMFFKISPSDLYYWMYVGGFGTSFSWQNTLTKAAPLILTALCTALPARLGLIIIGGEGALVLGGLAAAGAGLLLAGMPPMTLMIGMALSGMLAGGVLIAVAGALRHWRGVNATISSLLLTYIAIGVFSFMVEGPMRDPASLNKPSTYPVGKEVTLDKMLGLDVHWGLAFGVVTVQPPPSARYSAIHAPRRSRSRLTSALCAASNVRRDSSSSTRLASPTL